MPASTRLPTDLSPHALMLHTTHQAGLRRTLAACVLALSASLSACSSLPEDEPDPTEPEAAGSCAPASTADSGATLARLVSPLRPPAPTDPTPPPATLPSRIDLQGQLSLKLGALGDQPAKGLSLGFFFSGGAESGQLDLMTLMGSQMAQVSWQGEQAWLTDERGRQRYEHLDELSQAALGEALPLRALVHWMQGQPDPALPSQAGPQNGTFEQQGWHIDAHELDQKKLTAQRPGTPKLRSVLIKIYLDR